MEAEAQEASEDEDSDSERKAEFFSLSAIVQRNAKTDVEAFNARFGDQYEEKEPDLFEQAAAKRIQMTGNSAALSTLYGYEPEEDKEDAESSSEDEEATAAAAAAAPTDAGAGSEQSSDDSDSDGSESSEDEEDEASTRRAAEDLQFEYSAGDGGRLNASLVVGQILGGEVHASTRAKKSLLTYG